MMSQAPWSFESNAGSFRFFCDGRLKNQTKDERALPLGDRANKEPLKISSLPGYHACGAIAGKLDMKISEENDLGAH